MVYLLGNLYYSTKDMNDYKVVSVGMRSTGRGRGMVEFVVIQNQRTQSLHRVTETWVSVQLSGKVMLLKQSASRDQKSIISISKGIDVYTLN